MFTAKLASEREKCRTFHSPPRHQAGSLHLLTPSVRTPAATDASPSAPALPHSSISGRQRAGTPRPQALAPQPRQQARPALPHFLPRKQNARKRRIFQWQHLSGGPPRETGRCSAISPGSRGRVSAGLALEEEAEAASSFPSQRQGVPRAGARPAGGSGAGGGSRPGGGRALQPPRPAPLHRGSAAHGERSAAGRLRAPLPLLVAALRSALHNTRAHTWSASSGRLKCRCLLGSIQPGRVSCSSAAHASASPAVLKINFTLRVRGDLRKQREQVTGMLE